MASIICIIEFEEMYHTENSKNSRVEHHHYVLRKCQCQPAYYQFQTIQYRVEKYLMTIFLFIKIE